MLNIETLRFLERGKQRLGAARVVSLTLKQLNEGALFGYMALTNRYLLL